MTVLRPTIQRLLHEKRKAPKSFTHIYVTRCKPYAKATGNRDHRRHSTAATEPITFDKVAGSSEPLICTRLPIANSFEFFAGARCLSHSDAPVGDIATGTNDTPSLNPAN